MANIQERKDGALLFNVCMLRQVYILDDLVSFFIYKKNTNKSRRKLSQDVCKSLVPILFCSTVGEMLLAKLVVFIQSTWENDMF